MNDSPHEPPGDPSAEPLHDALHSAVTGSAAEHVARGYRVPESAVRSRARRRRTVRIAATGTLSLSLLMAAGIAVASLEAPDPTPPAFSVPAPDPTTATRPLGAHAACGLSKYDEDEGSEFIDPVVTGNLWVTLRVEDPPLELTAPVGGSIDLTVVLQNRGNPAGDDVHVVSTEGPVFLALDDFGVVVGYARLDGPINPVALGPADSDTWSGFGPLLACPGAPAADGFLAAGQYGSMIVQSFEDRAAPTFDVVLSHGDIVVTPGPGDAATRTAIELPTLPACGEAYPPEIPEDALRSTVEQFDVIEKEPSGDTGGGGIGPDNSVIHLTVAIDRAAELMAVTTQRWHYVLLRDGVVVGTMVGEFGPDSGVAQTPHPLDRAELTVVFDDCTPSGGYRGRHVLDGEYTLFGFVLYDLESPAGVRDEALLAVGPHAFEHHPPDE